MSVFNRIGMAIELLRGKSVFELIPSWQAGRGVYPLANFENNVRQGYRKNELIFACVGIIADSAASASLRVHNLKGEEQPNSPLQSLIDAPNPVTATTQFDFVWLTLAMLWLSGRAYWEKVRSRAGKVVQLWPLRPDWVTVIPLGKSGQIAYQYNVPGEKPVDIPNQDILDFKLNDPLNLWAGMSPVSVALRVGDIDNSITDYLNLFFKHGGNPPGLLSIKHKVGHDRRLEIRAQWREVYGGWRSWLEPAVLDADAEFKRVGFTFEEMGFTSIDERSEVRICAAMRVPPVLIGARIGLDRMINNAKQSEEYFWRNTLMPQYKRILDELNADLAREFPGTEFKWDLSEVPALQEDRGVVWQRAREAFEAGLIYRNEAREEMGLDALEEEDDLLITPGASAPQPADQDEMDEMDEDEMMDDEKWTITPPRLLMAGKTKPKDDDERLKYERTIQDLLVKHFMDELKRARREAGG